MSTSRPRAATRAGGFGSSKLCVRATGPGLSFTRAPHLPQNPKSPGTRFPQLGQTRAAGAGSPPDAPSGASSLAVLNTDDKRSPKPPSGGSKGELGRAIASSAPQAAQNLYCGRFSLWQLGQVLI